MLRPLSSNTVAADEDTLARVSELSAVLSRRAKAVDERELDHTVKDLEDIIAMWLDGADGGGATWRKEKGTSRYFLISPSKPDSQAAVFPPTPQSMRDVDPPAPVRLLGSAELTQIFGQGD